MAGTATVTVSVSTRVTVSVPDTVTATGPVTVTVTCAAHPRAARRYNSPQRLSASACAASLPTHEVFFKQTSVLPQGEMMRFGLEFS
jgi:hypothetical protein